LQGRESAGLAWGRACPWSHGDVMHMGPRGDTWVQTRWRESTPGVPKRQPIEPVSLRVLDCFPGAFSLTKISSRFKVQPGAPIMRIPQVFSLIYRLSLSIVLPPPNKTVMCYDSLNRGALEGHITFRQGFLSSITCRKSFLQPFFNSTTPPCVRRLCLLSSKIHLEVR
jgi:hypothetical protein